MNDGRVALLGMGVRKEEAGGSDMSPGSPTTVYLHMMTLGGWEDGRG